MQERGIIFPDLTVFGCSICLCFPMGYVGRVRCGRALASSGAAACTLNEAVAVGTFGNGGVLLMSADGNGIERAVVLGHHIVLTLRNGTSYAVVFVLVIHDTSLLE